jgi:hypothetical protein
MVVFAAVLGCTVLDSTFASTGKLFGPEVFGPILRGKDTSLTMLCCAVSCCAAGMRGLGAWPLCSWQW